MKTCGESISEVRSWMKFDEGHKKIERIKTLSIFVLQEARMKK